MAQGAEFAPYRPLEFSVRGPFCSGEECRIHPDLAPLRFDIREVYGTSSEVSVAQRYVVRGDYVLAGTTPFAVSIAVFTKAFGATAYLPPGQGRFEVSTEILELNTDPPNGLGIVVSNAKTGSSEIVRWIMFS